MIDLDRRVFDGLAMYTGFYGPKRHEPQCAAVEAFLSGKRYILPIWGRRTGKTRFGAQVAKYALLQENKRIWIVAPTYDIAGSTWEYILPMVQMVMSPNDYKIHYGAKRIITRWGTVLECKSADRPDSLISKGVDLIIFDEAATVKERVWQQQLMPTLLDTEGQVIFPTTPRGRNWIFRLFESRHTDDMVWAERRASTESPYLSPEQLEYFKRTMDPRLYQQEIEASFITFARQVYDLFDPVVHVIESADLTGWEKWLAVDPGLNNPTGMLWIAYNPLTEESVIYDEHRASNMLFPDVLRLSNKRMPEGGYHGLVCDVAGKARSQETGASFVSWMRDNGQWYASAGGRIVKGVNRVRSLLMDVNGRSRLKVLKTCELTIDSLINYAYPEDKITEEPLKDNVTDHLCDALRYYCAEVYTPSSKGRVA